MIISVKPQQPQHTHTRNIGLGHDWVLGQRKVDCLLLW